MALTRINNQALTNVTSAGLPSGSIVNVTTSRFTGTANATTSGFTATGHSISVTPSSSSNSFLIMNQGGGLTWFQSGRILIRIYRKIGTGAFSDITGDIMRPTLNSTYDIPVSFSLLDSPATTDTVVYEVYVKSDTSGATIVYSGTDLNKRQQLIAMEIAG